MVGEWPDTSLGEMLDIKHGFAFQGEFFHDEPQGHILLTPGNFAIGGGFKAEKFKYYDGPIPNDEFVLRTGELLVTMTDLSKSADTLGYPALVPARTDGRRYLHNQRLGKILIKDNDLDVRYLYYLLCSDRYRHEVLASATGTTVKHTSPERIKRFRFLRPPLPEQRAIAEILGALDDKIELNRRMNETLEAIAHAIFRSWFVDFDPVRAKMDGRWRRGQSLPGLPADLYDLFPDSFEDSALGKIPWGWHAGKFGDVADNPRISVSPDQIPDGAVYVGLEHIPKRSIGLETWGNSDGLESGKFRFNPGDILFGKLRPYFHKVAVAPDGGVCSTDIFVIRPKSSDWAAFTICLASSTEVVEYASALADGTRMPRTNWHDLAKYETALPPPTVAAVFDRHAMPLIEAIRENFRESRRLAAIRDALLPKLISGEMRLNKAERVVEVA